MSEINRPRLVARLLVAILAVYVVANVVVVAYVPMLHRLKLELLIQDVQNRAPVSGANVSWLHSRARHDGTPNSSVSIRGVSR